MTMIPMQVGRKAFRSVVLCLGLLAGASSSPGQTNYLDNETDYRNQDPANETRRSPHFRLNFGHYDRDGGMSEAMAQGNLQMYEHMWNCWVNELGLHDINESCTKPDGKKYRANFNFLMTWNDGGDGGAYSTMDGNGFFYAMANPTYCAWDPPSGATPHEFGHVWEGSAGGFNGTDSSGAWWECTANWMMLQFVNVYPAAGAYLQNSMYYPAHGRDYYDSWLIWETAHDDPRYGALWVNNVWTNYTADQQAHEFIIDRMIRCDASGSPDKAGGMNDLWGDMARKMVTWDFQRQQWLSTANSAAGDDGADWVFYQRCRTPLVPLPGTNDWYRPAREHVPMEFGFNFIPLTATPGTTVTCNFQPQCDPLRQSDWRACLVAVSTNRLSAINTNGYATYSTLWNNGANSLTLSLDQTKVYLVVIATPKPMKTGAWNAYLLEDGLQFPYAVSFTNATPRNVVYPKPTSGVTWKSFTNAVDGTVCRNIASGATVAATAYVSSNAMILDSAKVQGRARIEDYAVVRNGAQVRDYAVVSGHAVVQDNAQVYGNAKVRDWARVFGYVEIFENGKVIEHANCGDGNASTHTRVYGSAVVKGTTYVYDTSTFNGCLIMEGDSANGNGTSPASQGVHFGWGWGQDVPRFSGLTNNNYQYCGLTFEDTDLGITNNPVFALDEFGINHGFLMNGCRSAADPVAPKRGGLVLPLDGVNQYVELHNSVSDFRDTTIAVWFKNTGGASDQRVWSLGDGNGKEMYLTCNDPTTGTLRLVTSNGTQTYTLDGGAAPLNAWTHVAVAFNGTMSNSVLYVNGLPVATDSAITLFPESLNARLMANANYLGRGNAGNYFQGSLDDFRVFMKALTASEVAALYATPAPAAPVLTADTPPAPPSWLAAPAAVSDNAITMSASRAVSAQGWSEYYFACVSGAGHDSGWVSFNKYTDVGLAPETACSYTVRMRDRDGHVTNPTSPASATTLVSGVAGNAASFAYGPVGIANGQITMQANVVTNASGKTEYFFTCTSGGGHSSGWIASPSWTDTGLTIGNSYAYSVTVRDGRGNTSVASATLSALARDDAAPLLPMTPAHWTMRPYATLTNTVCMTAQTASDASGVQYRFRCVSGGGPDSAWQTSPTFVTPVLADGTYVYQYQLRDGSARNNTNTMWSSSYPAIITPTTGYHAYTLSQVVTNADDYLVNFPAMVTRVNTNNYQVQDLVSGASITVEPSTSNLVTKATLAFKNVTVKGHLYTRGGSRVVTYSTVTSNGVPVLNTVSGKVTNSAGLGIAGATVYFSDKTNASANPVTTATTTATGTYTNGLLAGTWYVAAGASAYNTSADRIVTINNANVAGIDFGLVSNAVVSGVVTRQYGGGPVASATVYFSRSPGASVNPVFTTTTDTGGKFSKALQNGVWYVVAVAPGGGYISAETTITVDGTAVSGVSVPLLLAYTFDNGTLQGWTDRGGGANHVVSRTDGDMGSGQTAPNFAGIDDWNNRDASTSTLWLRSPDFVLSPSGDLTFYLAGGTGAGTAALPANESAVPMGEGATASGFMGVALRDTTTGNFVLKASRSGNGSDWQLFTFTAAQLGAATVPGRAYTLDFIDVYKAGGWNWLALDSVSIPGLPTAGTTNITASAGAGGSITPSGTTLVILGQNQPFTIASQIGYAINNVLVDGVAKGAIASYTFTNVLISHTIAADFVVVPPLTITASAGANGSISPSGPVQVSSGANQTFTVTPNAGYSVSSVSVDGVSKGAIASYTFTNVIVNHTITANFAALPTYTITASAGAGGTISPSGATVLYQGQNQAFTIIPLVGYAIANILVDGVSQGALSSFTFTNIVANHTITANFVTVPTYTITASAGPGGAINPSGAVAVSQGQNQAFTIAPLGGYTINTVTVDGVARGAITSYTFTNVTANHTLQASFTAVPLTFNFDDGTLQGWTVVSSDPGNSPNPTNYASVTANNGVSPQAGTRFVMCSPGSNRDNAHNALWIRSPQFAVNQAGSLTFYLAGGTSLGGYPGTSGTLPSNASQIPLGVKSTTTGLMGVALRDTATGTFVLTAERPGPSDSSWRQISWDLSPYLNNGKTYTLELFDYHSGTAWSFLCLDSVTIPGTTNAVIFGAATTTAFTTTSGTASAAQSFPVSGVNLTGNITATAPAGFELSSDGNRYAATASFPQSSGRAAGTLSIRLAATAPAGTYNSQAIVLSSPAASEVAITTPASGNEVTMVVPPSFTAANLMLSNGLPIFVIFNTISGYQYTLLYKAEVNDVSWTALNGPGTAPGNNGTLTLMDTNAVTTQARRFYRLQMQ